ncbi:hypothetical protein VTN77DRAFT_2927 [Rasamsonia byssochlamydoides]|uniref:uncharacterized protein n=1 Tax=Rasamsonia byssochlamydoides TaxID=89139 RepID=UPI003742550D
MRIATLQFAPRLGDVEGNMRRADELLKLKRSSTITTTTTNSTTSTAKSDELGSSVGNGSGPGIEELRPDILVLPEMAFTGYNFPSLQAIKPYLEPQGRGPTAQWARETARHLKCKVCVGYPEISKAEVRHEAPSPSETEKEKYFNSLLVVDENGEILLNYRKQFLYYTDETWASEGDVGWGFHALEFDSHRLSSSEDCDARLPRQHVPTTFGICMDINPYKFEAPFTAWEFANRVLDSRSQLVIVSTAWLTVEGREAIASLGRHQPDMDTFNYWIRRFWPLIEKRMAHDGDIDGGSLRSGGTPSEKKVVIVFANRTGVEEGTEGVNPTATYAGTSTIIAITQKLLPDGKKGVDEEAAGLKEEDKPLDVKILCWDIKGAAEEGICFADTLSEPKMTFGLVKRSDDDDDNDGSDGP